MVKLKIEYLPDYSEEYSVRPQGKKPPQVQLKDGWNLVAVGGPAPPEKPDEAPPPAAPIDPMKVPEYVVAASNVPIGLYESVFDTTCGKKYLKGWRYVGFPRSAVGARSESTRVVPAGPTLRVWVVLMAPLRVTRLRGQLPPYRAHCTAWFSSTA